MKYTPNSKSKKFAVMRKTIVKSLMTLMAAMTCCLCYAQEKIKVHPEWSFESLYYNGRHQQPYPKVIGLDPEDEGKVAFEYLIESLKDDGTTYTPVTESKYPGNYRATVVGVRHYLDFTSKDEEIKSKYEVVDGNDYDSHLSKTYLIYKEYITDFLKYGIKLPVLMNKKGEDLEEEAVSARKKIEYDGTYHNLCAERGTSDISGIWTINLNTLRISNKKGTFDSENYTEGEDQYVWGKDCGEYGLRYIFQLKNGLGETSTSEDGTFFGTVVIDPREVSLPDKIYQVEYSGNDERPDDKDLVLDRAIKGDDVHGHCEKTGDEKPGSPYTASAYFADEYDFEKLIPLKDGPYNAERYYAVNPGKYKTRYEIAGTDASNYKLKEGTDLVFEITPKKVNSISWGYVSLENDAFPYDGVEHYIPFSLSSSAIVVNEKFLIDDKVEPDYEFYLIKSDGTKEKISGKPVEPGKYEEKAKLGGKDGYKYILVGDNLTKTFYIGPKTYNCAAPVAIPSLVYNGEAQSVVKVTAPTDSEGNTIKGDWYISFDNGVTWEKGYSHKNALAKQNVKVKFVPSSELYAEKEFTVSGVEIEKKKPVPGVDFIAPVVTEDKEYTGEHIYICSEGKTIEGKVDGYFLYRPKNAKGQDQPYSWVNVITHEFSWIFVSKDDNYEDYEEEGTFKITPKPVEIEWKVDYFMCDGETKHCPIPSIKEGDRATGDTEEDVYVKASGAQIYQNLGEDAYVATAILDGTKSKNYTIKTGLTKNFWVSPAVPVEGIDFQAPTWEKQLPYTGEEQDLFVLGKPLAMEGKMEYGFSAKGTPDWKEEVLKGKEEKLYYLNYKFTPADQTCYGPNIGTMTVEIVKPDPTTITLTLAIDDWTYGDPAKTPKVTGNTCEGKETYTYYTDEACTKQTTTANGAASNGGVPANAGTYYVKATVAASGNCAEGTSNAVKFTIAKQRVYVRWSQYASNYKFTYDGEPHMSECNIYQYAFKKGDDVKIVTSLVDDTESIIPGTYTAKAVLEGDDAINYYIPENQITQVFYITKLTAQYGKLVPSQKKNETYDGKSHTPFEWTETGSSNEATEGHWEYYIVEYNSNTISLNEIFTENYEKFSTTVPEVTQAGDYRIYFIYVPDDKTIYNVNEMGKNSYLFTLDQREITVEWPEPNSDGKYVFEYSGIDPRPLPTLKGAIGVDKVSYQSNPTKSNINVGTYNTGISLIQDAANYKFAEDAKTSQIYTIVPAQLTLTWDENKSLPYTSKVQYPKATLGGYVAADKEEFEKNISYKLTSGDGMKVGDHTVEYDLSGVSEATLANYKEPENLSTDYEITAVEYDYTAPSANELTYTGVSQSLVEEGVPGTEVPGEFYYYVSTSNETPDLEKFKTDNSLGAKNAGTYYVFYYYQPADGLEATKPTFVKVEISKAKVAVAEWSIPEDYTKEYDGDATYKPTATFDKLQGTDDFQPIVQYRTVDDITSDGVNVGIQHYRADVPVAYQNNYVISEDNRKQHFEITPKGVTIIWPENKNLPYNEEKQAPIPTINTEDIIASDAEKLAVVVPEEYWQSDVKDGYTAKAVLTGDAAKNYKIVKNEEVTFNIIATSYNVTSPTLVNDFVYTGKEESLIKEEGTHDEEVDGHFEYSIDGKNYFERSEEKDVTGKNVDQYTVYMRFVPSDSKYENTVFPEQTVNITPKTLNLAWRETIEFDLADVKEGIDWSEIVAFDTENAPYSTDKVAIVVKPTTVTEAKEYTATASLKSDVEGVLKNYDLKNESHSFVVKDETTPDPTLTRSDWTYGDEPSENQFTNICDAEPKVVYYTDEDCKTQTTAVANGAEAEGGEPKFAGDYWVVATVEPNGSCAGGTLKDNFSIKKRTVSIKWLEKDPIYEYDKAKTRFPRFDDDILGDDKANVVISKVVKDNKTEEILETGAVEIGEYTAILELTGIDEYVKNYILSNDAQLEMKFSIVEAGSIENIDPSAFVEPLTYNGENQKLIEAGKSKEGVYWYALGDGEFFEDSIPVAKNANLDGYTVKYKLVLSNGEVGKTGEINVPIKKYLIESNIWTKTEFTYNGAPHTPLTNVKSFGNDDLYVKVEGSVTECGSDEEVTAILSGEDKDNYELSEEQNKTTVVINKSNYIIKTNPQNPKRVYDGMIHELVIAGTADERNPGKFTYSIDEGEYTDTIPMGRDAKDYVVVYQFTPDNQCYITPNPDTVKVSIAKKDPKIDWGKTTFVYNGDKQTPSPLLTDKLENEDVDVKIVEIVNGPSIKPGTYTAIAELTGADSKNYNLSNAKISQEFTITNKVIDKPTFDKVEFTYDSEITHLFVKNDGTYSITVNGKTITGNAEAKEPGEYKVSIIPAAGYTWSDGSVSAVEQQFKVKRIKIEAPARDMRDFYFDGTTQTYELATNEAYTITGNSQKYVAKHDVVVSLKDINHYEWSDGSVVEKHYDFEIKKATVKLPTVDSVLVYTYDGTEKRFDITYDKIGSILADSNDVGTEVGKYVRTVVLNMDEKGGYTWSNFKTDTIKFYFEIKPQPVIDPRVETTYFKYDGNEHQFKILGDTANPSRYSISMDVESATDPDTFYATCSLYDKKNYIWDHKDNSDDIEIKFIIGDGKIGRPDITKTKVYTGKPVVFVTSNSAYTVVLKDLDGNVIEEAVEVGDYQVTVTPKTGFTWENDRTDPVVEYVAIIAREVEKPVLPEEFTYDGTEKFRIPESEFYEIAGDTAGIEPGMYKATLTLKPNYKWNDQTVSPYDINVKIEKIVYPIPEGDGTEFIYTGEEQTYKIVVNEEICKVTGNKQTNAGKYNVIVSLLSKYYRWSDNTETARSYPFTIKRASVNAPGVAKNTFDYDGKEHKFEIVESDKYIISPEHKSETEVGTYKRTVSLVDTINHCWSDGSVKDKEIEFNIVSAKIDIPSFVKESEYTGEPIEFVPAGVGYTVTNRVKTDVGSYVVTVSLEKGYVWNGSNAIDIVDTCVITPLYVEKPNVKDATFTYDGTYHSFGFKPNDGYTFVGDTAGKEPGIYPVTVKLNPNYLWDGDTNEDENFTFIISKQYVPIPLANATKFVYDGTEKTYEIAIPEDSLFTVTNNVQTNAGTYTVKAVLKDHLHYQWTDSTIVDKPFDFVIAKAKVPLPTAPTTNFIFDGKEKKLIVDDSKLYDVADSNKVATKTGKYIRTATLTDSLNYTWFDGTTSYKSIIFNIGDGTLEDIAIQHVYEYTGDTIVFVPKDAAYTVENGSGINAGTYIVKVTPNPGYRWSDSTKTERIDTVVIKPIVVEKPQLILEYTYCKNIIDFNVPVNPAYDIVGATYGMELGNYKVTLNLHPNHVWSDGKSGALDYIFSINKIIVPIPPVDSTVYVYNGKRQTYYFEKSPYYNVLGNVQTYAGSYEISVLLTDFAHTMWSDSTTEVKTFNFEIGRAKVENPKAVQSTFAYDGKPKNFLVQENSRYEALPINSIQTEVGTYERSVMLKDTLNYTWADGSVTNKTVIFEILSGVIEIPVIETEYVYNGAEITFVPENPAYTVENGVKVNAGDYIVVVKLNPGYIWSDSTTASQLYNVVIKPRPIAKPEFPATNIYTYDDTIRGVDIPLSDGYVVTGTTQTKEPGTYDVVVSLDPNYIWMDNTTDDLKYRYVIKRNVVEIPAASDSVFKYTGSDVTYPIVDTVKYYVVKGHHQTAAGLHFITVTLADTLHYEWSDGTTENKIYEFLIGKFKVDYPVAVIDSFVYDGNVKLFDIVPNKNYIIDKHTPAGIQIGEYERTVSLIDTANFLWPDGSVDDKVVKFIITKNIIPSILVPTELTYTGDSLTLVPQSPAYTLVNSRALNAGSYDVIIIPSDGYTWPNGDTISRILTIKVKPKMVKIPDAAADTFKYNAMPQTYDIIIPNDSLFTVTENIQTEVGNYNAVVSLKDSLNYCWTDSTNGSKLYPFVIENSNFILGPITQSMDMGMEATPGHIVVFDVDLEGRIYKYWVRCDSCPAFNTDTQLVKTDRFEAFDIQIPDTVKPGVYTLDVYLMSGSLIKSEKVTLRVNYPASNIYVVWNDVLTIDNTSNLFHTYQWYKNGEVIPGATRQYYQEKDGIDGYYMCLVNNEVFVGPAFFKLDKPLWIKAVGGENMLTIEIVGNIPSGSTIEVCKLNGVQIKKEPAQQFMQYTNLPGDVYLVRLVGSDQSVKVLVK